MTLASVQPLSFYWAFSFIRDEQAHDPCPPVAYDLVGAVDTKRMSPVLWVTVGTQGMGVRGCRGVEWSTFSGLGRTAGRLHH